MAMTMKSSSVVARAGVAKTQICSSRVVVVRAAAHKVETTNKGMDRRQMMLTSGLVMLSAAVNQPAHAFLGIGDDGGARYAEETQKMVDDIKNALAQEPNSDAREEAMKGVKEETVAWVSKYRRDPKYSGRPSFSLLYSAVNALDGQLVSFGLKANFPAKRLERMMKSITDAERQLQRGR